MSTIILMPFHWASDMNPTLALSKKLAEKGHRVCYLCIPDVEERIRGQGFDFVPIFSRIFPKGELERQYSSEAAGQSYGANEFRARLRGMCELLREGEIERCTRGLHPDLFLVSSGTPWVGIAATKLGTPVITFSSTLISVRDPIVPPFGSKMIPGQTSLFRLRTYLAWKRMFIRGRLVAKDWNISRELLDLARHSGFPRNSIDFQVETWPRLALPELVFCPKDFDFPRAKPPKDAFFVEASLDEQRSGAEFPWDRVADGKPLVYCSLGSITTYKARKRVAAFFQMFMDAMRRRPDWQAIVTVGNYLTAEDFNCPSNVVIVQEAPQVDVLKRASLMVYHGGFNGVKEAIFYGVPMALIPLFYDQAGNAARVVYHGLGTRMAYKELSADGLIREMDGLFGDTSYEQRMKSMSQKFVEIERRAPSIEIIERAAGGLREQAASVLRP